MKNILLITLAILGLTSCSKDSFDLIVEPDMPEKAEIMVRVTYLKWQSETCPTGYNNASAGISNAQVSVFQKGALLETSPIRISSTYEDGSVLLEDVEPGTYTILIETPFGTKSREVTTALHRRSSIDFSF